MNLNPSCVLDCVVVGGGPATTTQSKTQDGRSEEHTSELQSHVNLVCRLLLEKKKKIFKKLIPRNPLSNHNVKITQSSVPLRSSLTPPPPMLPLFIPEICTSITSSTTSHIPET